MENELRLEEIDKLHAVLNWCMVRWGGSEDNSKSWELSLWRQILSRTNMVEKRSKERLLHFCDQLKIFIFVMNQKDPCVVFGRQDCSCCIERPFTVCTIIQWGSQCLCREYELVNRFPQVLRAHVVCVNNYS